MEQWAKMRQVFFHEMRPPWEVARFSAINTGVRVPPSGQAQRIHRPCGLRWPSVLWPLRACAARVLGARHGFESHRMLRDVDVWLASEWLVQFLLRAGLEPCAGLWESRSWAVQAGSARPCLPGAG